MTQAGKYPTPAAVESAIKQAATKANHSDHSTSIGELIRQAHFDRFLSRVFSGGAESEWVLKGGSGMLARVPSARATTDIDLYRTGFTREQALNELRRLATVDLGDHFRFVYRSHMPIAEGDGQPHTAGYRVDFDTYIGVKKSSPIKVDLAIGVTITDEVIAAPPSNRLDLPRLEAHDYRLYPVVDQIADKVCATIAVYAAGASTREKDLVDLVILCLTQAVDARALNIALNSELRRRGLPNLESFVIPDAWGVRYTKMARAVAQCADFVDIQAATNLVASFVNPVLARQVEIGHWDFTHREWR